MNSIIAIFLGGGLGSLSRYGISRLIMQWKDQSIFPWATLMSNIMACLILAIVSFYFQREKELNTPWMLFWIIGYCGSFSTFSTFSLENWELYRTSHYSLLLLNIFVSIGLCFLIFAIFGKRMLT